jgi:hypothetical protein
VWRTKAAKPPSESPLAEPRWAYSSCE